MKKNSKILTLILVFLTIFSSCTSPELNELPEQAPVKKAIDLDKYYKLERSFHIRTSEGGGESAVYEEFVLPYTAYIEKDLIIIDNTEYRNPEFKALQVRAYDYFLTKYKIDPEKVGISAEFITVYSSLDKKKQDLRFMKIDDKRIPCTHRTAHSVYTGFCF